jgi:hypothetical protein
LAEYEAKEALSGPGRGDLLGDVQHKRLLKFEILGVDLRERGVCREEVISKALWEAG